MKKIMSLMLALLLPLTTVEALNKTAIDNSHIRLTEKFLIPPFGVSNLNESLDKKPEHIRLTEKYLLLGPNIAMPKEDIKTKEILNPDLNDSAELPEFFEERNKTFFANPKSNQEDRFNSLENERNYVTSEEIIIPPPGVPESADFKTPDVQQDLKPLEGVATTAPERFNDSLTEKSNKNLKTSEVAETKPLDSENPVTNEKSTDISSEKSKDLNKENPSKAEPIKTNEISESTKNTAFINDSFKYENDLIEKSHIEENSSNVFFIAKKTFSWVALAALASVATSCVTFKNEIQTFMKDHCPEWAPVWIKNYLNKDNPSELMPIDRLAPIKPIERVDIRKFYNDNKINVEVDSSSKVEEQGNKQDKSSEVLSEERPVHVESEKVSNDNKDGAERYSLPKEKEQGNKQDEIFELMPVGMSLPISMESLDDKKLKINDVNDEEKVIVSSTQSTASDSNISSTIKDESSFQLTLKERHPSNYKESSVQKQWPSAVRDPLSEICFKSDVNGYNNETLALNGKCNANDLLINNSTYTNEENAVQNRDSLVELKPLDSKLKEEQDINDEIENLFNSWKGWAEENEKQYISFLENIVLRYGLEEKDHFLNTYGECYTYKEYLNRNSEVLSKLGYTYNNNRPWYKKAWFKVKEFFNSDTGRVLCIALLSAAVVFFSLKLWKEYQEYNLKKGEYTADLQQQIAEQQGQNANLQQKIADMQVQHGYDKLTWEQMSDAERNAQQEKINDMQTQIAEQQAQNAALKQQIDDQKFKKLTHVKDLGTISISKDNKPLTISSTPHRFEKTVEAPHFTYEGGLGRTDINPQKSTSATQTIPDNAESLASFIKDQSGATLDNSIQKSKENIVYKLQKAQNFISSSEKALKELDNCERELTNSGAQYMADELIGNGRRAFDSSCMKDGCQPNVEVTEKDKDVLQEVIRTCIEKDLKEFRENKKADLLKTKAFSEAKTEFKSLFEEFRGLFIEDNPTEDELIALENNLDAFYKKIDSLPKYIRFTNAFSLKSFYIKEDSILMIRDLLKGMFSSIKFNSGKLLGACCSVINDFYLKISIRRSNN